MHTTVLEQAHDGELPLLLLLLLLGGVAFGVGVGDGGVDGGNGFDGVDGVHGWVWVKPWLSAG